MVDSDRSGIEIGQEIPHRIDCEDLSGGSHWLRLWLAPCLGHACEESKRASPAVRTGLLDSLSEYERTAVGRLSDSGPEATLVVNVLLAREFSNTGPHPRTAVRG
ncbi:MULTISPECIES: hypothetical protein [unclassified Streptomyces]|uniref:hypothetical protein n=1 Tax=unclassified Streptomyces TaxID=2593676 RepID=UPI00336A623E